MTVNIRTILAAIAIILAVLVLLGAVGDPRVLLAVAVILLGVAVAT